MKKILLGLVLFYSLQIFAANKTFSGFWGGLGSMLLDSNQNPITIPMEMTITQTADQIQIHDCWQTTIGKPCYKSAYDIVNGGQIYANNKKIGDIYPYDMIIFNSHEQASEQMIFKLNEKNQLWYRYTFTSFDGKMQTRTGVLDPL